MKKNYLIASLVIMLIFISITACKSSGVSSGKDRKSVTYYISSSTGDDNGTGMSPKAPWKTFEKLSTVKFYEGDKILLKKGDQWENKKMTVINNSFSGEPVLISTYGKGSNPQVYKSSITAGYVRFDRAHIELIEDPNGVKYANSQNEAADSSESDVDSGEVPVSKGKMATTSNCQQDYDGAKAVDGKMSTYWCTQGLIMPSWLKIDLGQIYQINKITQSFYTADLWRYKIEVSDDDTNYSTIVDVLEKGEKGNDHTHEVNASGRYVKMTVITGEGNWATSNEFKVYGTLK